MSSIITNNFRVSAAQKFINSVESSTSTLYSFIARTNSWNNDANVPQIQSNISELNNTLKEILYMKKIARLNTSLGIQKNIWKQNYIYSMYRSDIDLYELTRPYYVTTPENNVYKCINNNNNSPSSVRPTGKSKNIFSTSDGYFWKYMFSIDEQYNDFISDEFIPVQNTFSIIDASRGINSFYIQNSGTQYNTNSAPIILTGDGQGFVGNVLFKNGTIDKIEIINNGSGYRNATATIGITTTGTPISIIPMIDPPGGHGANPAQELGANYVLISSTFFQNESNRVTTNNDFRKIGIIENPRLEENLLTPTKEILSRVHKIKISDVIGNGFVRDEVITGSVSGNIGFVLDYDETDFILQICQTSKNFDISDVLIGQTSGTTAKMISTETGSVGFIQFSTINTITLDNLFSGNIDPEFDMIIKIINGTGQNQVRKIISFNTTTKTGTLSSSWDVLPDITSEYVISYYKLPETRIDTGHILYQSNIKNIQRNIYQNERFIFIIDF